MCSINLEKLKVLASEISKKEAEHDSKKKEIISSLSTIKQLILEKKCNRKIILEKIDYISSLID